jgi:prophage antirepressor-like protein
MNKNYDNGTSILPYNGTNITFELADLCRILGLSSKGVNQRLSKEVISNYPLETSGGIQQALFVNEDGLYDVILDSRKPEAKLFRKWVTSEVLPAIRRTGGYMVAKSDETPEENFYRKNLADSEKVRIFAMSKDNGNPFRGAAINCSYIGIGLFLFESLKNIGGAFRKKSVSSSEWTLSFDSEMTPLFSCQNF